MARPSWASLGQADGRPAVVIRVVLGRAASLPILERLAKALGIAMSELVGSAEWLR